MSYRISCDVSDDDKYEQADGSSEDGQDDATVWNGEH